MRIVLALVWCVVLAGWTAVPLHGQSGTLKAGVETYVVDGGTVSFTVTIVYPAPTAVPSALSVSVQLPEGWGYVATSGAAAVVTPVVGDSFLEWAFANFPAGQLQFSFNASYRAGLKGDQTVTVPAAQYRSPLTSIPIAAVVIRAPAAVRLAPSFTAAGAIQPSGKSVVVGQTVVFNALASGEPAPTYQWNKDGRALVGATASSLTLPQVGVSAAGVYAVVATNVAGTATSANALLTVSAPTVAPVITQAPQSQSVKIGGTVTFSALASGSPAPAYQWVKDGATLPGATGSSLTLGTVGSADAGGYVVRVSNSAGSVVSPVANLTITANPVPPAIQTPPVEQVVVAGARLALEVAASGTPPLTYQWTRDGTALPGATERALVVTAATKVNAGVYTVAVANSVGSATSVPVRVIVDPASTLSNLSVRARIAAPQALIVGAVVDGGGKPLLIRAAGPALNQFGLAGLEDPRLELVFAGGIVANDNWLPAVGALFDRVGAFPFPVGSKDAAVSETVAGAFTARVSGNDAGVLLVEAYDVEKGSRPRLVNLSARNWVGQGDGVLVAGFALSGTGTKQVLIRAVGPGLGTFGVSDALSDPRLTLFDSAGRVIAENDDWPEALAPLFARVGGFVLLAGSKDAALSVELAASATYSVQVAGGRDSTGEALIEIYEVW